MIEGCEFARTDPYRAATSNKVRDRRSAAGPSVRPCVRASRGLAAASTRSGRGSRLCVRIAKQRRHRCVTQQGILNGIDAVAVALGQDWRAIEASCLRTHTLPYQSLTNSHSRVSAAR